MRTGISLLLAVIPLLLASAAQAQDSINPDAADGGDGTQIVVPQRKPASPTPTDLRPSAEGPSQLEVDADACRYAVEHVPSADTEYKADVDANGNPVTPADIGPRPQLKFPTTIPIPITSRLGRMLTGAGPGYRADAVVGMISLVDGRLYFNGQPIGDDPDAELAALCRNAAGKKTSGAQ